MKLSPPKKVIPTFLTFVGGIVAIISFFENNSKDVKLEAFISFNDYEINPVFREKFNELVEKVAGQFALNEKISDYNLLRKNGFIEVSITNKGALPSINTIIDIPNDGVAIVITPNGKKY